MSIDQEHALVLLIKEMMEQLDEVAWLKSRGHSAALSMQMLREMSRVLRELEPPLREKYLDLLVRLQARSAPPSLPRNYSESYAEATVEAKQQFMRRIRHELKKSAA